MGSIVLYLIVFALCSFLITIFLQKRYENNKVISLNTTHKWVIKDSNKLIKMLCIAMLCSIPIILMYGLRVNVGTDYNNYEAMYNYLHSANYSYYIEMHNKNVGWYYAEIGYYFLNRIAPSYRALLFIDIVIIMIPMWYALIRFKGKLLLPLSIFVFLSSQFIYSMNGVRFIIAISFLLLAFSYLADNKVVRFIIFVLIASLFHKTAIIALALIIVKELKNKKISVIRDVAYYIAICAFAMFGKPLLIAVSNIPLFYRYFSVYQLDDVKPIGFSWVMHIAPILIPMLLLYGKELILGQKLGVMFKIYITYIPLRILGMYNVWMIRLTRIPQIIEVILVSYIVNKISNIHMKKVLIIYYVIWYILNFVYYVIVTDKGDSIPYLWII